MRGGRHEENLMHGGRKGNIAATLHAHTPLNAFTNGCATGQKMAKNLMELFADQVLVSNDWENNTGIQTGSDLSSASANVIKYVSGVDDDA